MIARMLSTETKARERRVAVQPKRHMLVCIVVKICSMIEEQRRPQSIQKDKGDGGAEAGNYERTNATVKLFPWEKGTKGEMEARKARGRTSRGSGENSFQTKQKAPGTGRVLGMSYTNSSKWEG